MESPAGGGAEFTDAVESPAGGVQNSLTGWSQRLEGYRVH